MPRKSNQVRGLKELKRTFKHGGEVYDKDGSLNRLIDFSTTVEVHGLPKAWKRNAARELGSLQRYPQPFSPGLGAFIEKLHKLPKGSVIVGNGVTECIGWIARASGKGPVALEKPCFGEYENALQTQGAGLLGMEENPPTGPRPRTRQSDAFLWNPWAGPSPNPPPSIGSASVPSHLVYEREEARPRKSSSQVQKNQKVGAEAQP